MRADAMIRFNFVFMENPFCQSIRFVCIVTYLLENHHNFYKRFEIMYRNQRRGHNSNIQSMIG